MTVTIYSANVGGHDGIWPQRSQDIAVEWVYFSDQDGEVPAPWRKVRIEPDPAQHPNMAAKWYKTHPSVVADGEFAASDRAIWIDASMEVTHAGFAREAIASLDERPVATWKHPRRDCIYNEVIASLGAESQGGRYDALPLHDQAAAYRAEGYPEHAGLYATGTTVWTPEALELGEAWFQECALWGYQDQVSFPVVCRRLGIRPAVFPHRQILRGIPNVGLANRWLIIHNHAWSRR